MSTESAFASLSTPKSIAINCLFYVRAKNLAEKRYSKHGPRERDLQSTIHVTVKE